MSGILYTQTSPFSERGNRTDADRFRYAAQFPDYRTFVTRLKSFEGSQWNRIASRQLTAAGFFNPGRQNTVQCFYCGLGMTYQWQDGNDTWRDHAQHVTGAGCDYLNHMKGRVFVQSRGQETGEGGAAACFDPNPCRDMNNCRLCVWEFWMTPDTGHDMALCDFIWLIAQWPQSLL